MKIKTITCHEVYNYGASLQEYALLKYLESLGHEAKTIHYKPDYLSSHFNLWKVANPKMKKNIILKWCYLLYKLPTRLISLKRKKSFDEFSEKYIKKTSLKYESNDDLLKNLPEADIYICGSDQIWNSFFQNGKDPAFYLNFVPEDKVKVSYAASFAIDSIEENLKAFVKKNVESIDFVSVRETSAVDILSDLGIECVQVLDPVFLLPVAHWDSFDIPSFKENYIFVYDFDTNQEIRHLALKIKKEKGYKIYTVNSNIKYADHNFNLEGPEVYLALVKNAKKILTNSFHAVAFSLIFKKNFLVFNRNEKINTRMQDLLGLLNLSEFMVCEKGVVSNNDVNYEKVAPLLGKNILKSKKFLKKSLTKE